MLRMEIALFMVLAFVAFIYFSAEKKYTLLHKTFSWLLIVMLFHLVMDGITVYTVNHLDTVPAGLNLFFHLAFFVFMDLTVLVTAMYMYDHLVGFHRCSRKGVALFILPELVSLGLIVGSMGNLTYVEGVNCPKCGGRLLEKTSRKNRKFYGCEHYPECDFVSWEMPVQERCPKCGSYMTLKRNRKGESWRLCANETCRYKEEIADGQHEEADV